MKKLNLQCGGFIQTLTVAYLFVRSIFDAVDFDPSVDNLAPVHVYPVRVSRRVVSVEPQERRSHH